ISQAVRQHGGIVQNFTGDSVLAVFGLSDPPGNPGPSAIAAVHSAVGVRTMFDALVSDSMKTWRKGTGQAINIGLRCAIHTGDTLVGTGGLPDRGQLTLFGLTVDLARRIECLAHGESRQILISQTTKSLAEPFTASISARKISVLKDLNGVQGELL